MNDKLDLDMVRRSAEPVAVFGSIIVRELVNRLEQAEQQVARVRELHTGDYYCDACSYEPTGYEGGDFVELPCPTIRALDGEQDG